jgi:predicted transcriptional regulator
MVAGETNFRTTLLTLLIKKLIINSMSMKIVSVSLPTEINERITKIAIEQKRSKSQIVLEAVEKYEFDIRWAPIRKYGDRIAKKLGITSEDDVERIFGRKATSSR